MNDNERLPARKVHLDRFNALTITWKDGTQSVFSIRYLRQSCPCANCRDSRSEQDDPLRIIDPAMDVPNDIHVLRLDPVGHYALSFQFSDGHSAGIYSYEYLAEIAPEIGKETTGDR